jgi:hypothetical protein
MNLAPLLDSGVALVAATITAVTPIIVPKILQLLKIQLTNAQEQSLETTLENAVGEALKYGQAAGDTALSNVTIKNAAISQALTFAMNDAPAEIEALGYSPAEIGQLIANKIATKLHVTAPASPEVAKTAAAIAQADAAAAVPVEPAPAGVVA